MKVLKKIFAILLIIILIPVLFVNIVIISKSYISPDRVPDFMGWKPFITLSGSMEPVIKTGDLVFVKETDVSTLKIGDIVAFRENDIVITHRIVDIIEENGEKKLITKGDNNNAEDRGSVSFSQIEGKYESKIEKLGNVAVFLQTPTGILVALSIPVLLYALLRLSSKKSEKKYEEYKKEKEEEMQKEIERLKKENEKLNQK